MSGKTRARRRDNYLAYALTNTRWLKEKSTEEGVESLPGGIYYKVLHAGPGEGETPALNSVITAHYSGRTINGLTFDTSRNSAPLACRLNELIQGWVIAMQHMHIGDRWEIYVPAEMGYGSFSQPGIPAGSTLIFDIELIGIA